MTNVIWQGQGEAGELPQVAAAIARHLTSSPSPGAAPGGQGEFCLWLQGPLGAGKTTLTGHILRQLGLPPEMPVTSPTFTYMNEYRVGTGAATVWYAHLDLYRGTPGLNAEDLGLLDARPFRGVFVEWPERLPDDPGFAPSHVLEISFVRDADGADTAQRCYLLRRP